MKNFLYVLLIFISVNPLITLTSETNTCLDDVASEDLDLSKIVGIWYKYGFMQYNLEYDFYCSKLKFELGNTSDSMNIKGYEYTLDDNSLPNMLYKNSENSFFKQKSNENGIFDLYEKDLQPIPLKIYSKNFKNYLITFPCRSSETIDTPVLASIMTRNINPDPNDFKDDIDHLKKLYPKYELKTTIFNHYMCKDEDF